MMIKPTRSIEFLGGPLDGLRVNESAVVEADFIFARTALRAGELSSMQYIVRMLLFHGHPQPDVIAIYTRTQSGTEQVFRYHRSVLETDELVQQAVELTGQRPS